MADAMGLGKTLTILALIIADKLISVPEYCNATLIGKLRHFNISNIANVSINSLSIVSLIKLGNAD